MGRPSKYQPEFREAAVAMVRTSDTPRAEIARDPGIHDGTLSNWVAADKRRRGELELTALVGDAFWSRR